MRCYARKNVLKKSKVQVSSRAGNASRNGRSHPNSTPAKGTGTKGFGEVFSALTMEGQVSAPRSSPQPSHFLFPSTNSRGLFRLALCPVGSKDGKELFQLSQVCCPAASLMRSLGHLIETKLFFLHKACTFFLGI